MAGLSGMSNHLHYWTRVQLFAVYNYRFCS